jgi:hypothetical protein
VPASIIARADLWVDCAARTGIIVTPHRPDLAFGEREVGQRGGHMRTAVIGKSRPALR